MPRQNRKHKNLLPLTDKQKQARILELEIEIEKEKLLLAEQIKQDNIEFYVPYDYQRKVYEAFAAGFKIVIIPISNKTGKSFCGSALVHSWAKGYEPWNIVPDTFPGAVKVNSERWGETFFMPSSLGIKPPVDIRITGEDWEEHLKKTVVPALKYYAQPDEYETSKNNVGVEASWIHKKTGSKFSLMTYSQPIELFESFMGDGWWGDEPPSETVFSAMSRGLFTKGGKVFLSMTLIGANVIWLYKKLIKAHRPDVKVIGDVTLWDVPHLYQSDTNTLLKCGLAEDTIREWLLFQRHEAEKNHLLPESERRLKEKLGNNLVLWEDEFGRRIEQDAVTYALQSLKIHRFIKDLKDASEVLPRVFGKPQHLTGKVWPNFTRDRNIIVTADKKFKYRIDWPVVAQVDWHPGENIAISFMAVDPWGRHIIIDEAWGHFSNLDIRDEVVRRMQAKSWRMGPNRGGGWPDVEIDALAKGDESYVRNRTGITEDSYKELTRLFKAYKLTLGTGSKAEKNYIAKVDTWMMHEPPLFYVLDTCVETISQIEEWTRLKDGTPSPDGHFGECIGRFSQMGVKYTVPNSGQGINNNAGASVGGFT